MATNDSTARNDKYFFRNETLAPATDVPRDVTWALSEGSGIPETEVEADSSYVGEIIFNEKTGKEEWQPSEPPSEPGLVQCPTPVITSLVSQQVVQNAEGVARTNVVLAVNCLDNVEYEVVVTAA